MSLNTSYTIQMASKISGVGVHTIRAWEKRYKALEPNRDSSGHRTYTKTDVEKLMLLSELCLLGYTISKVAKLSIDDLKLLLKDLGKSEESLNFLEFNLVKESPAMAAGQSISILLFALRSYKLDVINQELGKLKNGISAKEMALEIILPLSLELNELSAQGVLNASQEEAVVSLLRFHAGASIYRRNETREQSYINVIVAATDEETFDLETVMACLLCQHYGFNFNFLGHKRSVAAIIDSANFLSTGLIILSSPSRRKNLALVEAYLEKLFPKVSERTELLYFGPSGINADRTWGKRFISILSLNALDEFLSQKKK